MSPLIYGGYYHIYYTGSELCMPLFSVHFLPTASLQECGIGSPSASSQIDVCLWMTIPLPINAGVLQISVSIVSPTSLTAALSMRSSIFVNQNVYVSFAGLSPYFGLGAKIYFYANKEVSKVVNVDIVRYFCCFLLFRFDRNLRKEWKLNFINNQCWKMTQLCPMRVIYKIKPCVLVNRT